VIFDLDPDESLPFARVAAAARRRRAGLTERGLESYVKTTGGKDLHVWVPLEPGHGADRVPPGGGGAAGPRRAGSVANTRAVRQSTRIVAAALAPLIAPQHVRSPPPGERFVAPTPSSVQTTPPRGPPRAVAPTPPRPPRGRAPSSRPPHRARGYAIPVSGRVEDWRGAP
jgi:hypothetical protein